jgi:hypothetical protein
MGEIFDVEDLRNQHRPRRLDGRFALKLISHFV